MDRERELSLGAIYIKTFKKSNNVNKVISFVQYIILYYHWDTFFHDSKLQEFVKRFGLYIFCKSFKVQFLQTSQLKVGRGRLEDDCSFIRTKTRTIM